MHEAIAAVRERCPTSLYVSTCGFISRDLYNLADGPENFYLVGSMGMAGPVGLGVALARPDKHVVVLDGDGSLAMNLGALPMIAQQCANLLHVVLDNGAHESTGGQRPVAIPDPAGLALAAGYRAAASVATALGVREATLAPDGPTLLHIHCALRGKAAGKRVELTPQQLVARFRTAATA